MHKLVSHVSVPLPSDCAFGTINASGWPETTEVSMRMTPSLRFLRLYSKCDAASIGSLHYAHWIYQCTPQVAEYDVFFNVYSLDLSIQSITVSYTCQNKILLKSS